VNTSPLILLSKIGLLELLRAGDLPVIVPQAVLDEIARHGPEDQSLLLVRSAGWLQVSGDTKTDPPGDTKTDPLLDTC
jgi:predicted nucleic acid-binding protein